MNDTNDTILPLNKTENLTQTFIEENFNQTYGEINYVNRKKIRKPSLLKSFIYSLIIK